MHSLYTATRGNDVAKFVRSPVRHASAVLFGHVSAVLFGHASAVLFGHASAMLFGRVNAVFPDMCMLDM